jgi:hypothetical protein
MRCPLSFTVRCTVGVRVALVALLWFTVRPTLGQGIGAVPGPGQPKPGQGTVEQMLADKDQTIAELEKQLQTCRRQIAEQRQIIREQALHETIRSLDELLAFFPTKFPQGRWNPAESVFQDCWFQAIDGIRLHGWYFPHDHPSAVILFIHGNGSNLSYRAPVVQFLHDRFAASVMIFDYRGYGRSEGVPTIEGVLRDARAARLYLSKAERTPENAIVLLGESLGGAVAVDLAGKDGATGLILESTFSSLRDVAASHYAKVLTDVLVADRLDSAVTIKKYHGPLLQSHGDRDRTVPYELARKLFDAANEPKQFIRLPGKDHNDPKTGEYYRAVGRFLSDLRGSR